MKKGFLKTTLMLGLFVILLLENKIEVRAQDSIVDVYNAGSGVYQATTANNSQVQAQLQKTNNYTNYPNIEKNNDGVFTEAFQTMYATALIWITKGVAWVVSLTGWIFDKTLEYTTKYPEELKNGIYGSWKIVRDFANIILVFSLLYLGIKTIIEGQGFADKKILVGVIMAAVLINFSFFFTKDIAFNVSNTVGLQIMNQAKVNEGKGYSESFMTIVNPQKVISGKWGDKSGKDLAWNSTWDMLMKYTGQIILLSTVVLILGVIFIGVSITLIYRLLIFLFLIITSPFGLISTQIPWLKSMGSDWMKQLKHQSIYFPTFAIVLYIVLYIVSELATSVDTVDISNGMGDSIMLFIFKFILIIGFMFGLLILPNKMGAAGAEMMTSAGGYLKNKITNLPRGTARFAGRAASTTTARTGRYLLGNKFANSLGATNDKEKLKKLQERAQGTGLGAISARMRLSTSEKLKEKSYDFRNTKVGGSMGLGKGIESYSAAVSSKKKKYEDNMEKKKKLYGYDEIKTDKSEIIAAEADRNNLGNQVEETRKEYEKEKVAGKLNKTELKLIADRLLDEEKQLEEAEINVGKLKSKGTTEYIKFLERQRKNVFFIGRRLSRTQKAALEKLKKESEKKWKEEGKYKGSKKDKSKDEQSKKTTLRTPVISNYVPPENPPTLPRPTGL